MKSDRKTKNELIKELESVRRKAKKLETLLEKCKHTQQDITERKRAEKALRESEHKVSEALEFNRRILHTSSFGILTYKKSGECISANAAAAKLIGGTVAQLLAQNFHEIPSWKKSGMYQAAIRALETGIEQLLEVHLVTTFGKEVWMGNSFLPFDSADERHLLVFASNITERKQTEAALQESEELYHSLFENMLNGFAFCKVLFDQEQAQDFVYLEVNDAFEKLTGLKDVVGKKVTEIIPGIREKDPKLFETYGRVALTGKSETFEIYLASLGEWHSVSLYSPRKGYFVLVFDVITERKRAEEHIRYQVSLIENISDAIISTELNFVIRSWNKAAEAIYGWEASEVIGKLMHEVVPSEYPNSDRNQVLQQFRANGLWKGDTIQKRKDGTPINILSSVSLVYDSAGNPSGIVAVNRDVTERKQMEKMLRESEVRFRELFNRMSSGVAIYEAIDNGGDFIIMDFNLAAEKIEKVSTKDILGKRVTEVFPGVKKFGVFEVFQRVWQTGQPEYFPQNIFKKDEEDPGSWRESWVFKLPKDEIVVIYNDITERKGAEEQLRQSKEQLELLNQHLVGAVENERARISREIHDELGQSLTALKIDMNWMQGHIIPNGEIETKLRKMIDIVNTSIRTVQQIASDLRPDILEDLGLIPAIEWYCEEFEKRTGIQCETSLEEIQSCDAQLNLALFRVTQEALTNVARHSHATIVEVKLHQTKNNLILEIIDDGIGIDENKIASNKSLGIMGMRERIRQFNGSVDVTSFQPQGTEITVVIQINRKS